MTEDRDAWWQREADLDDRNELARWRAMFSNPYIAARELAALRAELDDFKAMAERVASAQQDEIRICLADRNEACAQLSALRAENERLRAERAAALAPEGHGGYLDLARKLAAANALLERWERIRDGLYDFVRTDTRAHLAGQPAAPVSCDTCEDAGLRLCPCTTRAEAEQRVLDAVAKMLIIREKASRPPYAETVVCRGGDRP